MEEEEEEVDEVVRVGEAAARLATVPRGLWEFDLGGMEGGEERGQRSATSEFSNEGAGHTRRAGVMRLWRGGSTSGGLRGGVAGSVEQSRRGEIGL